MRCSIPCSGRLAEFSRAQRTIRRNTMERPAPPATSTPSVADSYACIHNRSQARFASQHETCRAVRRACRLLPLRRKSLGTAALSACLLKFPFMTWKIMAGIHWERLRLWLKGARFHRNPHRSSRPAITMRVMFEPGERPSCKSSRRPPLSGGVLLQASKTGRLCARKSRGCEDDEGSD